ncbi:MAG: glycosyl hydrolase [Chloroflexi bacterium]|nr:glycosyl hydrolase [Chloroflexota bacterium]
MSIPMEKRGSDSALIHWLWRLTPLFGAGLIFTLLLLVTGHSAAQTRQLYPSPHERFGFNFDSDQGMKIEEYDVAQLKAHWYLDYTFRTNPTRPNNMQYVQMIRTYLWHSTSFTQTVGAAVAANPGELWIVGNEPDRDGQDGLTPDNYAMFYHDVYTFLKQRDPTSRVAVGAVVQGTPIRLHYLNIVLDAYQQRYGSPLPTDVWTLHGFILPECKTDGCWGASIPPGMDEFASEGIQYGINDHNKLGIFKQHVVAFRQWMADHGYRDKPLIMSEYGILLSPAHGFPYATVRAFMLSTFDYFLNTMDSAIGYPADQNRLVQSWSWFSLNNPPYDINTGQGFNGNLFNPMTKQIEPLGQDFATCTANITKEYVDLNLTGMQVTPAMLVVTDTSTVTVQANLINNGGIEAQQVSAQLWLTDTQGNSMLVAENAPIATWAPGCAPKPLTLLWQPKALPIGHYTLTLKVKAGNANQEVNSIDNVAQRTFLLLDKLPSNSLYLPLIQR